jgi:hypothetical protein
MPAIVDNLLTVFEQRGLPEWEGGMRRAAGATGMVHTALTRLNVGMGAAEGGLRAAGDIFSFFGRAALAASQDAATFQRTAGSFKGQFPVGEVGTFSGALQNQTGIADDSIASMLGLLGIYGTTAAQAKQLALPILNTAEAMKAAGVSSETLARQIGQAFETGKVGRLGRLLGIDQATFEADKFGSVLEALKQKGGAAAVEFRNSYAGALQALRTELESVNEELGESAQDPFRNLAEGAIGAAKAFKALPDPVKSVITQVSLLAGVAIAGYSIKTGIAAAKTIHLAAETLTLGKRHRQAAIDTEAHADAQDHLNRAMKSYPGGRGGGVVPVGGRGAGIVPVGGNTTPKPGLDPAKTAGTAAAAGWLGKLGKLGKFGAPAAAAAAIGAEVGLSFLPEEGAAGTFKDVASGAIGGAVLGGIVGNVPGAIIGGAIGGGVGYLGNQEEERVRKEAEKAAAAGKADPAAAELAKQTELLQEIRDALKSGSVPYNTRDISGSDQERILAGMRRVFLD